ncbi:MAG: glucoamylase [Thermoleophilaceae bacterium]|jgi:glucoamylase|nr:glucoamylase [Thermoleophilaceae bacterium]
MRRFLAIAIVSAVASVALAAPAAAAPTTWTPANKDGFGTSATTTSKVWHTLGNGELTEVYYPDLGTPSVRELHFVVSDGTFTESDTDAPNKRVDLAASRSLTYRQVNADKARGWKITKTYVTDPSRSTLVMKVHFESSRPLTLTVLYDPALANDGSDDTGTTAGNTLVASDSSSASALTSRPTLTNLANQPGDDGGVVQTAQTQLTGRGGHRDLTLALGFGSNAGGATQAADASLSAGFNTLANRYARGWRNYLGSLKRPPRSADAFRRTYDVSVMTLAAHEDKTFRGGYIASPTMPWAWSQGKLETPVSGAYHLVWARDLYQIATALQAAGDRAGAQRALTYLFDRQQKPDGSFPQNSTVDGATHWTNLQLDEVAFPIVLAWQLGRTGAGTYTAHVKRAADFIVSNGPQTPQERWENQSGWSPATIAAEVAGLVCAADIARKNGDSASADLYLATADQWRKSVQGWTATTNGPYAPKPYYLRLTKDAKPDAGTTYSIGDGGPSAADQRSIVDPSFLELVRLGLKRPRDAVIRNTLRVVDAKLAVRTPNGTFWHRFNFDGYGETREGAPWDVSDPDTFRTIGRAWPIFAGERGEYELLTGARRLARSRLRDVARSGNSGLMLPEQVWDQNPPAGQPAFLRGEGTFSATPLAWTHAQFVRLAWSIDAGRPVEQPRVVACRYVRTCR